MGKTGKYLQLVPTAAALLFVTATLPLGVACQPTPSSPGQKTPPAYTLDVEFPDEIWAVTLEKGESVTLPVTIESLVDVPVAIRLTLEAALEMPEFIEYEAQEEFMSLEAWDSINTSITISVNSNAISGDYILCIGGELQEAVAERSGMAICFTLTIADI